ncbi:class I SAM-dependent methyltransferase [Sphingomicrobium clamense]|uniref:Methyltransferase n=1 Tax=Sphingomicrobium clamense TaxID=2851013 RepID=A0ABS6V7L1_9SPHN|nr:methyltransferase [Sphingomicrobium sp. B8]MBW0145466.1 methyltransferase [Sphingomicrobium sp. B8]
MRDRSLAFLVLLLAACSPEADIATSSDNGEVAEQNRLDAVIASDLRSAENKARDQYRHPKETLEFFGVEADDLVVEMWPGGGWYTEILALYLADEGSLALVAADDRLDSVRKLAEAHPDAFKSVLFSPVDSPRDATTFPAGSADVVLTFRNVHNWEMGDEPYGDDMFAAMFDMLRPGGTLGVVEHRLPEDRPDEDMKTSGYMKQSRVVALAEAAGFELVEASEINANPNDTADHPRGVWTLPPRLRLEDQDRDMYLAIGESDRMTLKFRKPE